MNNQNINNEQIVGDSYDRRGGYFMVDNIFCDKDLYVIDSGSGEIREMNIYEWAIMVYLFRCTNNGSSAFPSYEMLGKKCKMSRRTAIRAVNTLCDSGYLSKKSRGYEGDFNGGGIKKRSNVYTLNIKKLYE